MTIIRVTGSYRVNGKGIINLKDIEGEPVLIITFPVCFTVTKQNIIAALVGFV